MQRGITVLSDQKPWKVFAGAKVADETGPDSGLCKRTHDELKTCVRKLNPLKSSVFGYKLFDRVIAENHTDSLI